MRYTIKISGTGCYAHGNPSRAEHGQKAETLCFEGDLDGARARVPPFRAAEIFDKWHDLVAIVRSGCRPEPEPE